MRALIAMVPTFVTCLAYIIEGIHHCNASSTTDSFKYGHLFLADCNPPIVFSFITYHVCADGLRADCNGMALLVDITICEALSDIFYSVQSQRSPTL